MKTTLRPVFVATAMLLFALTGSGQRTLLDDTWKFGSSDEVLFKLIEGEIAESTMPKIWQLEPDQVWKMIAYIRSVYTGDPSLVDW